MRCGKCKADGPYVTVAHVKACYAPSLNVYNKRSTHAAPPPRPDVDAGFYVVGEIGQTEQVIKVQAAVHGSGKLYAKQLNPQTRKFEYVPGLISVVRKAGRRLTLADAMQYGEIYGICCRCGRKLTADESIEAGIGPICAGKL